MSVPAPARVTRTHAAGRLAGAGLALALVGTACGSGAPVESLAPPATPPGSSAGAVVVTADADVATTVQRIRNAITGAGGSVVAVVDHAADAEAAGVSIPPSIEVIGGAPAAALPLLRVDQRAAAELPPRYLVRQTSEGSTTVTANGADYVAAVSGVAVAGAQAVLHDATTAVLAAAAPGAPAGRSAPLVGVTPEGRIPHRSADGEVAAAVERLRAAADAPPTRTVAAVDLAAGSAADGPPLRPTTVVLVSHREADARLLAAAPSIGLDLPLRFVVWLDERGDARLGYPDVRALAARHGIAPDDPAVALLAAEAERLAGLGATAPPGPRR